MHVWESRIVVRIAEYPTHYPMEVFTMTMGENSIGGDAILEELRTIAYLDGQLEFPEMHQIYSREGQTNWGASGSFGEYVIEVSANILSTAGAAGIGFLVHKAFSKIKTRSETPSTPLSIDAARNLLKAHIALHYDTTIEELTEKDSMSTLTDGVFEFSFLTPDGTEFGGSVGGEDPLMCTRVWRKSSSAALRPEYLNSLSDTDDSR